MKINKLLNAVKHLDKVYEGVKNSIWKDEFVEDIANDRYKKCTSCAMFDVKGLHCAMPKSQPCCASCGCSLAFKVRSLSSSCPLGHWPEVMSQEDEDKLTVSRHKPKKDK
jgi:hypothetical protein|tara:strand:+ start:423 stop:752 length:330 start_codon:yes stop_codon:yes gene_type:complete